MRSDGGRLGRDHIRVALEVRVARYHPGGELLPVGNGIPFDREQRDICQAVASGGDVNAAEAALWAAFEKVFPAE
ncbi:hypothetical protein AB0876_17740 [Mycobacterium sp. NPDC049093]